MSSLSVMLRDLGVAIGRLRDLRTECGDLDVRLDAGRAGIAAGIFYIRCLAVSAAPREKREAALESMRGQFNTLARAIARLQANRKLAAQVNVAAVELLEKADVLARSIRGVRLAA